MEKTLTDILEQVGGCKVVIDALDESKTFNRVIQWCKNMHKLESVNIRLLVTSQTQVLNWQDAEQIMSVTMENVSRDISTHVRARLDNDEFMTLHGQPDLQNRVREMLVEKADGM
jgi:hypothetical protein